MTSRQRRTAAAIGWAIGWGVLTLPWDASPDHVRAHRVLLTFVPHTTRHMIDAVLNLLFYLPLGAILESVRVPSVRTVALGLALSLTTELAQLFSPTRVPSLTDVVFNTAGTAAGVALARSAIARRASASANHPRRSFSAGTLDK